MKKVGRMIKNHNLSKRGIKGEKKKQNKENKYKAHKNIIYLNPKLDAT